MLFKKFNFNPKINETLKEIGFETPTEIQNLAIPLLMESKDIIASAETGSGKTAAFLLPIIDSLLKKERGKTRVLVLVPTRELAVQIVEHFGILAKRTSLKAAAVYGGVEMNPQIKAFKRNVDLIAATPGRLLDHFQYHYSKLPGLKYLVLDEADRMLDMGFLPDVKMIIRSIPKARQTMLFSATMPYEIVELSKQMLENPVALNIQKKSCPASNISHYIFPVKEELKKNLLLKLLEKKEAKSVLALTRTRQRANRLFYFLSQNGVTCERIHGNRSQIQRMDALRGFKNGKYKVLVATDIASRGIDISALSIVINYDVPAATEDYIHRSGRTARAEQKGEAYTLVSPNEEYKMKLIEKHIGKRFLRQNVDGFNYSQSLDKEFYEKDKDQFNKRKEKRDKRINSHFHKRGSYRNVDTNFKKNSKEDGDGFAHRNFNFGETIKNENCNFFKRDKFPKNDRPYKRDHSTKNNSRQLKKNHHSQKQYTSKNNSSQKEKDSFIKRENKIGSPYEKQLRNGSYSRPFEKS